MDTVMVVGPGRLGLTLASALVEGGDFDEVVVAGRHPEPPDHPVFGHPDVRYVFGLEQPEPGTVAVVLAVPDAVVPEIAQALSSLGRAPDGCAAFHVSGVMPTDVLEPLHHAGYPVGVLHPLVTVTDAVHDRGAFGGAGLAVTGGPEAMASARTLARGVGAKVIPVPAGRRPLLHAGIVLASTMMLPLLVRSTELMQRAGVDGDEALEGLIPLLRGLLAGIERGGVPEARRGPVARGDVETVALHLRALEEDEARLYATIGLEAARLSAPGLEPDVVDQLTELLGRFVHPQTTEVAS